jgi:hypothetical protein
LDRYPPCVTPNGGFVTRTQAQAYSRRLAPARSGA